MKIIYDLIQIHVEGQDPNVSLQIRGERIQRMSENISTSHKDTYQSEKCPKREQLTVAFQQRGAWLAQCCTYIVSVCSTKSY